MNTDKTLTKEFCDLKEYPIWYYKELVEVDIDYVILYLLTEKFVVDINGSKHEITFGKNRKHEIGKSIRYDDIHNSKLCSFEVINKGFKEGKWYIITDKDTTEEFKESYRKNKEEVEHKELENFYRDCLIEVINSVFEENKINKQQYDSCIVEINNNSFEELEEHFKLLFK